MEAGSVDKIAIFLVVLVAAKYDSSPSIFQGFKRSKRSQVEQHSLYLHSVCAFPFFHNLVKARPHCSENRNCLGQVLTHRSGSASMLSLVYSEVLKMLRLWGMVNFDVEVFFPHDSHSSPRGYHKQKSKEADQSHIMTSQSLLVEVNHILLLLMFVLHVGFLHIRWICHIFFYTSVNYAAWSLHMV